VNERLHGWVARLAERVAYEVWHNAPPPQRQQYADIALLATRYGCSGLVASELQVFSQNGEDGVLQEIFKRIGTTNEYFVEFGVEDGIECNTRFLAEILGWSGLYLEPDDVGHAALSARLAGRGEIAIVKAAVTPDNVNELFADGPPEPDLVSIDVDGQDYWIWEALIARPRVVVIEYNSSLAPGASLVEPKGRPWQARKTTYFGASRDALVALGERKGYRLVHAELAGVNLFFVRDDLAGGFEPASWRGMNFGLAGGRHPPATGDYVKV